MTRKKFNLLLAPIPIKYLSNGTKVLHSIITTITKECNCSDAWKFVAHHCQNGSYPIQGVYFDHSYSTVQYADFSRINIHITAINRLTDRILDVSSVFQKKMLSLIKEYVSVHHPII